MSDYLGRLAERALGLVPVIRPLIDSGFGPAIKASELREAVPSRLVSTAPRVVSSPGAAETVRRAADLGGTGTPRAESLEGPAPGPGPEPATVTSPHVGEELAAATQSDSSPLEIAERVVRSSGFSVPRDSRVQVRRPRDSALTPQHSSARAALSARTPCPAPPLEQAHLSTRTDHPRVQATQSGDPAGPPERELPPSERDWATSQLESSDELTGRDGARGDLVPAGMPRRQVHPRGSPPRTRSAIRRGQPTSSDVDPHETPLALPLSDGPPPNRHAPIVRVTIGTVEVRAVMPLAETAPSRAPVGPKLSLEEYLEQRRRRPGE
jgi:hypothetical protein